MCCSAAVDDTFSVCIFSLLLVFIAILRLAIALYALYLIQLSLV